MRTTERKRVGRPAHEELVVTTAVPDPQSSAGRPILKPMRTLIWKTTTPLALGRPFSWALERTDAGVRVRRLAIAGQSAGAEACQDFDLAELPAGGIPLFRGSREPELWVQIRSASGMPRQPVPAATAPAAAPIAEIAGALRENRLYRALLAFSTLGFAILLLLPSGKPTTEEAIVPPQFSKLLLTPAVRQRILEQSQPAAKAPPPSAVQVFRSQSVQKSIQRLTDSSPLSGLNAAELLGGATGSAAGARATASQLFDAPGETGLEKLKAGGPAVAAAEVGLIGEKGGAGYGASGGASVSGQGSSQFDLAARESSVEEGLTKEEVGKAIRQHGNEIRFCYLAALARNPQVEGKLSVAFVIAASGHVKSAKASTPTSDATLNQCILDHLTQWVFPKPHGGKDVGISFPFIFKLLGV